MWGIGLRADNPRSNKTCQWRGEPLLGEAVSAVYEAIRHSETGWAHPTPLVDSALKTATAGIKKCRPRRGRADNSSQPPQMFSFGYVGLFRGRAGRLKAVNVFGHSSGVGPDLALSEHGPCFVGGTVTLDDVLFTITIAYISQATLDSERRWTPLDMETGRIVGLPNTSEGTLLGNKVAHILRIQDTGKHWQRGDPQRTSPAAAFRVLHRVRLHTRIP